MTKCIINYAGYYYTLQYIYIQVNKAIAGWNNLYIIDIMRKEFLFHKYIFIFLALIMNY